MSPGELAGIENRLTQLNRLLAEGNELHRLALLRANAADHLSVGALASDKYPTTTSVLKEARAS